MFGYGTRRVFRIVVLRRGWNLAAISGVGSVRD